MQHIKTFESFINESIDENSFPKFKNYIESQIPEGKSIQFYIRDNRLMIGYFPANASMAELSKSLPEEVKEDLSEKFEETNFVFMDKVVEPDPVSGKDMIFSAVSLKFLNQTQEDLQQIEDLF